MMNLHSLKNDKRGRRAVKRVGRGPGSGRGKTCSRGQKGAGSRSGYKRRLGYEGGQFRLYMKLPGRGFSNVQFQRRLDAINLDQIEKIFKDGETVNIESLKRKGFINGKSHGIKILGNGELSKNVTIDVKAISQSAKEKLEKAKISINEKS